MSEQDIESLAKELALSSLKSLVRYIIAIFGAAVIAMVVFYFRTTEAIPQLKSDIDFIKANYVTRDDIKNQMNGLQVQVKYIKDDVSSLKDGQSDIYKLLIENKKK